MPLLHSHKVTTSSSLFTRVTSGLCLRLSSSSSSYSSDSENSELVSSSVSSGLCCVVMILIVSLAELSS